MVIEEFYMFSLRLDYQRFYVYSILNVLNQVALVLNDQSERLSIYEQLQCYPGAEQAVEF